MLNGHCCCSCYFFPLRCFRCCGKTDEYDDTYNGGGDNEGRVETEEMMIQWLIVYYSGKPGEARPGRSFLFPHRWRHFPADPRPITKNDTAAVKITSDDNSLRRKVHSSLAVRPPDTPLFSFFYHVCFHVIISLFFCNVHRPSPCSFLFHIYHCFLLNTITMIQGCLIWINLI